MQTLLIILAIIVIGFLLFWFLNQGTTEEEVPEEKMKIPIQFSTSIANKEEVRREIYKNLSVEEGDSEDYLIYVTVGGGNREIFGLEEVRELTNSGKKVILILLVPSGTKLTIAPGRDINRYFNKIEYISKNPANFNKKSKEKLAILGRRLWYDSNPLLVSE